MDTDATPPAAPPPASARWVRPELVRLGTLRDVAQGPAPLAQANNDKRS